MQEDILSSDLNRIREEYEAIYKDKLFTLTKLFKAKQASLAQVLSTSYQRIMSDQLLVTMVGDKLTGEYVTERVHELFLEIVNNEREIIINRLMNEMADLKFSQQEQTLKLKIQYEVKLRSLTANNSTLQSNLSQLQKRTQLLQSAHRQQAELHDKQAKQMTIKLAQSQSSLQRCTAQLADYRQRTEESTKKCLLLERDLVETRQNCNKIQEQNYRQLEHSELCLQQKMRESQTEIETKYKRKLDSMQKKVDEYKARMTQMMKVSQPQGKANEPNYSLTAKLQQMTLSHEQQVQAIREDHQRQIMTASKSHQSHLSQLEQHFQKLLKEKMTELQSTTREHIYLMEDEQTKMGKVVEKLDGQLQHWKNKCLHYEDEIDALKHQLENLDKELTETNAELKATQIGDQDKEGEIKQFEKQLERQIFEKQNLLKQCSKHEERLSSLQEEFNSTTLKLQAANHSANSLQNQNLRLASSLSNLQETLRRLESEAQIANQTLKDQTQLISTQRESLAQLEARHARLESSYEQNNLKEKEVQELKRSLSVLESQLQGLEHSIALKQSEYERKELRLQSELARRVQEASELSARGSSLSNQLQSSKQSLIESQSTIASLQLEISLQRESSSLQSNSLGTAIEELKTINAQNIRQITSLRERIVQKQTELFTNEQRQQALQSSFKFKLQKLRETTYQSLSLLKSRISSIRLALKEQLSSFVQHASFALYEQLRLQLGGIVGSVREMDQQARREREKTVDALRKEMSDQKDRLIKEYSQQSTKQYGLVIQKLRTQIAQKKEETVSLEVAVKALKAQAHHTQSTLMTVQNKLQQSQLYNDQLLSQHEHAKALWETKFTSLNEQYRQERDSLIQEHTMKTEQQQKECQQLISMVSTVKLQLKAIQDQHQSQKVNLLSQQKELDQHRREIRVLEEKKSRQVSELNSRLRSAQELMNKMEAEAKQIWDENRDLARQTRENQTKIQQFEAQILINRAKCDRLTQQLSDVTKQLRLREDERDVEVRSRSKCEVELKELKGSLSRYAKMQDVRALQQITQHTQELSSKVNQMRQMSQLIQGRESRGLR